MFRTNCFAQIVCIVRISFYFPKPTGASASVVRRPRHPEDMQHSSPGSDPVGDLSSGPSGTGAGGGKPVDPMQERLRRWQTVRSWARLIREAESLWHVDARLLHRLAAEELVRLAQEVPPRLRRRVNRWLERFHVATRLK